MFKFSKIFLPGFLGDKIRRSLRVLVGDVITFLLFSCKMCPPQRVLILGLTKGAVLLEEGWA